MADADLEAPDHDEGMEMNGTAAPADREALAALLHERRRFTPPPAFSARANAGPEVYEAAAADRLGWWEQQAEQLTWDYHWHEPLEWDLPYARWFVGGRLNVAYNCVDRHVEAGQG
ncbi:MAG TPA: acetyl-coenzyme A synthetase N-terminal domain-containing protein, partial [Acidimicrobiales bacterium]|nr:acetyl-coenzyme A synthetase N-terminal domain-containing protein [Acidimicrobiales bacterium]